MGNTVRLTITGRQWDESGDETVTETKAKAEYYDKDGVLYIFYEETPAGSTSPVKNSIKLKNNVLELTKRGGLNTRMVFDTAHDYRTDYQTPFGGLQLDIHTLSVTCGFLDALPQITAEYTLSTDDTPLSRSLVTINLRK